MLAFGQASNMIKFGPDAQMTAIVDNWAPYYIARVRAVLDGTWESSDSWGGLAVGEVEMAPYTNLPADVIAAAEKAASDVASGAVHPLTGPVQDRDRTERIAAAAIADGGLRPGLHRVRGGGQAQRPQR